MLAFVTSYGGDVLLAVSLLGCEQLAGRICVFNPEGLTQCLALRKCVLNEYVVMKMALQEWLLWPGLINACVTYISASWGSVWSESSERLVKQG